MSTVVQTQQTEDVGEFFAPTNTTALDALIAQYQAARAQIESVAEYARSPEVSEAFRYFFRGAKEMFDRYTPEPSKVFDLDVAIPALNAVFWSRAMDMTDVYDFMPDKRRQEWRESIDKMKTPEFEEDTVKATMADLLAKRMDFLAEMVDGIFSGLSSTHLTNQPEGFGKRMIIDYVYVSFGSPGRKADLVHDLRGVIAKFMGRDVPSYGSGRSLLERVRKETGVWHVVDGGAFRIRVYKKGTAHLEVHPQIAYRLNQILAHLHPMAIPTRFRQRPKRKVRTEFDLMQQPIPFAVLRLLEGARFYRKGELIREARYGEPSVRWQQHTLQPGHYDLDKADKHTRKALERVIEAIGGARSTYSGQFVFSYDASEIIDKIMVSGTIPDAKSHQFYPTPDRLARVAVGLAEIGDGDTCLEPSAGQGAIAERLPADRTLCIEVSEMNCEILRNKGLAAECHDFLERRRETLCIDKIVMNPPYSEGRWRSHLEHAASMLSEKGRLVAIIPASAKGQDLLPGFKLRWHGPYENEFSGTAMSVVIVVAEKEVSA